MCIPGVVSKIIDPLGARKYLDPVGNSALGRKIDPLGPAALANRYAAKGSQTVARTLLTPQASTNSIYGGSWVDPGG
jgi:hypothetical protein